VIDAVECVGFGAELIETLYYKNLLSIASTNKNSPPHDIQSELKVSTLHIEPLNNQDSYKEIENALRGLAGIVSVDMIVEQNKVVVSYDP